MLGGCTAIEEGEGGSSCVAFRFRCPVNGRGGSAQHIPEDYLSVK